MADLDHEKIVQQPATSTVSAKKKELLSTAMKRTSEWFLFPTLLFSSFSLSRLALLHKGSEISNLVALVREFLRVSLNFSRIFSQEIPIDVIIHAGGTAFSLHKVCGNF